MTSGPPERPARVRVTGPARRPPTRPATRTREIDEGTEVGVIYVQSLVREQLRLAGRVLLALGATVGSLPLLFHLAPGLADTRWAGVPVGWLALGVAVYPVLVVLGWAYVRRAERNEAAFADLLAETSGSPGSPAPPGPRGDRP
ncbi:hypothetical protein [Nocardioides perillae]|uniref:DUF485 domain-containing protein n=1 Tax=Nocardioides perillae TaxID=1119534 RepID=A0A7Y9RTS2_9ACTN|nr:hypothetical protein [Nocardioides perillae]NYG53994.1 hypothetical protein [Nocardioides perillae]